MKTIKILAIVMVLGMLALVWVTGAKPMVDEPVFCTADAKQCPNGSYVGRIGPNCEFAICPGN